MKKHLMIVSAVLLLTVTGLAGCETDTGKDRQQQREQRQLEAQREQRQAAAERRREQLAAERERERRQEARQAQAAAAAVEEEPAPEPEQTASCAEGYSPCVPPYPPDLDCDDVGGPIAVSGSDPHGFDADGDGSGCE